jgi:hypothetical protein
VRHEVREVADIRERLREVRRERRLQRRGQRPEPQQLGEPRPRPPQRRDRHERHRVGELERQVQRRAPLAGDDVGDLLGDERAGHRHGERARRRRPQHRDRDRRHCSYVRNRELLHHAELDAGVLLRPCDRTSSSPPKTASRCAAGCSSRTTRTGVSPGIVMCHGFSAVKEMYLDKYGQHFADSGMAALVYDNRNLGASDGEPRQEIDPWQQIRDYRDAISFARGLPEIDGDRIGIWGSSYSGAHVLVVGAVDRRVKCVVAQVPLISGDANARRSSAPT